MVPAVYSKHPGVVSGSIIGFKGKSRVISEGPTKANVHILRCQGRGIVCSFLFQLVCFQFLRFLGIGCYIGKVIGAHGMLLLNGRE